jgi:hypothetical protein
MKLAWLALALVACKPDHMQRFADLACTCETRDCVEAVAHEMDVWLEEPGDHGDREHNAVLLDRFEACERYFEGARRPGRSKLSAPLLPPGTPVGVVPASRLVVPSPAGFANNAWGGGFTADGPFEWRFFRGEAGDDAEQWLRIVWPITIILYRYRGVELGPIEQLAAPPGWTIVARAATATDRWGNAIYYMLIAAHAAGEHLVYASEIEAPAPVDAVLLAAVLHSIASMQLK